MFVKKDCYSSGEGWIIVNFFLYSRIIIIIIINTINIIHIRIIIIIIELLNDRGKKKNELRQHIWWSYTTIYRLKYLLL